jgi:16S rRNA (uracil1498-N3)-methyltransferase
MQLFYSGHIKGNTCMLDESESRHCLKVLRLPKGAVINVVDGKGNLYEAFISNPDLHGCEVTITSVFHDYEKRSYSLHLGISPIKNTARFEWFIEKSIEIGIDEITPVICRNTEKTGIKTDRINNIIISAMKQSVKAFKPVLNQPVIFSDFISNDLQGVRMIASCTRAAERSKIDSVYSKNEDAIILIGPEGDFSDEEIRSAMEKGYKPVHLGTSRLRTETAGIAACHSIYFINQ